MSDFEATLLVAGCAIVGAGLILAAAIAVQNWWFRHQRDRDRHPSLRRRS